MSAAAGEVVMGGVAGLLGWVACPRVMVRLAAVPRAAGNEAWREPARWGGRAGCGVMPTVGNGGVSSLVCLGTCRLTDNNQPPPPEHRLRRRCLRPREGAITPIAASAARSPAQPVDPAGTSRNGAGGERPAVAAATVGVPGPSVPAATLAVTRGDVAGGLDIFLRCMARRRLRLTRAKNSVNSGAVAAQGQGGVPACNKFLRALGDAGAIDDAISAYEAMVASGLRPTIVTFSTLISRAGACRRVRVAERFYREMLETGITPDVQAMNSLINAFSKAGSPDEALKVFDQMSDFGLTPSLITFNSLIDACARKGDIERARSVFDRLGRAGLTPNDRTFSSLIHSHAVRGQVDEAFSLLKDMRARGLAPNRVTYSALINTCGRAGQLARAFQTLGEMCNAGIEPNVITWTTLIDACGKGKELEWSFRLFNEMRALGTVPNGVTLSALMDACLKADELDLAFAVLEHMLDVGIEPTEVTYTSLLTQCARLGKADKAGIVLAGLDSRRRVAATNGPSSLSPYSSASSVVNSAAQTATVVSQTVAAQEAGRIGNTAAVVDEGDGEKTGAGDSGASWKIDPKLENDLLKLFGQADQIDEAFKMLEDMIQRRDSPDSETWLVLLNAVTTAEALDKAVALIERSRVEGRGSEINELTYSALLGACGRAKKLARAFRVVEGMKETGVKPTEGTYVALLEACRHTRDSKAAVEVFEAMETDGVRPGVQSYTSLLQAISDDNTRRTRELQRSRQQEDWLLTPIPAAANTAAIAAIETAAPHSSPRTYSATSGVVPVEERATVPGDTASAGAATVADAATFGLDEPKVVVAAAASGDTVESPTFEADKQGGRIVPTAAATAASATGEITGRSSRPRISKFHDSIDLVALGASTIPPLSQSDPSFSPERPASMSSGSRVERGPLGEGSGSPHGSKKKTENENPAVDNLFRVFLVFQEMRSRGVRPDLRAYNALVNACADVGELDRALEVVRQMVDEDEGGGLQPDAVTYTSLIKAAARATPPRVEEAEEIFAVMQQRTNHFSTFARPTEVTYAHLMRASVEAGNYDRALELWWQQQAAGVRPGSRSTRAALTACSGAGNVETALKVYRVMREVGIRPDNRSTLELVKLCRASNMPDMASRIMRERSNFISHGDNRRYHYYKHN